MTLTARAGDSPFLPGTAIQYAWDSTSLGWLKTCPRLYQYSMIEGWRSRGESVHLKFGQLYHSALEYYDKLRVGFFEDQPETKLSERWMPEELPDRANDHEEALSKVITWVLHSTWENGKPWSTDHPSKTRETLIRSIIWYLDHFKDDPAQTVVLANGKPAVELSFRMELDYGPSTYIGALNADGTQAEISLLPGAINYTTGPIVPNRMKYILCGHLDRVVSFIGGTYVMDRKTSSSTIGSAYFDQYSPDNQMSLYTIAAKVIYQTPVKGVIIDAVQIAVGFSRFSRGFTYRTESEVEEWLENTKQWLKLAEGYATAGFWPMNDKSCHHFGGCTFRKVCSKSPEVRQKFLETDFEKRPWNPLEVR